MKAETLLDAIGDVKDAYVSDLLDSPRTGNRKPWLALTAACLAVVLCLTIGNLGAGAGIGGEGNQNYYIYEGPVLPLTVHGDSDGLSASRNVVLDFSEYDPGSNRNRSDQKIQVTDVYLLTNGTDTDRTVTLLYPYVGYVDGECPAVSVNGALVPTTIHPGSYTGGFKARVGLDYLTSFTDYARLLTETDYIPETLDTFPKLDMPAYVYRLHDFTGTEDITAINPVLEMAFSVEPGQSWVFTDQINGGSSDLESGQYTKFRWGADLGKKDSFVIIAGEDLKEYTIQGYRTKDRIPGEELEDLRCTVSRYETTLEEVLRYYLLENWGVEIAWLDASRRSPIPADELYLGLAVEHLLKWGPLSGECVQQYADGRLHTILSDALDTSRVIWLSFDVTIPASGTVTVKASQWKKASTNVGRGSGGIGAYELATTLGSNLHFTSQMATILNTRWIEIRSQNFGFSLEKGITTVTLDTDEPYYWIKVRDRAYG